jgi:formate dehydrogenase subunit gamma
MFGDTFALFNSWFGWNLNTDLSAVQEQQYQALWHTVMAAFMIVVVIGHIYIGTVGMEGALSAMTTGDVDANWAKEHHSLWVDELEAEKGKSSATEAKLQPAE